MVVEKAPEEVTKSRVAVHNNIIIGTYTDVPADVEERMPAYHTMAHVSQIVMDTLPDILYNKDGVGHTRKMVKSVCCRIQRQ